MKQFYGSEECGEIKNLAKQVALGEISDSAAKEKVKNLAKEMLRERWFESPSVSVVLTALGVAVVLCGAFLVNISVAWIGIALLIVGTSWFLVQVFLLCKLSSKMLPLQRREHERLSDQFKGLEAQCELDQLRSGGYKLNY